MKKKIIFVQTNYPAFLDEYHSKIKNLNKLSYKEIKKIWANEYFGSSNFYSKNLNKYDWEADEIILNDWEMQSMWAIENNFKIKKSDSIFFRYLPQRIKNLFNIDSWMKQIFFEQIKKIKPDVVYMHDVTILSQDDIKKMKKIVKLLVGQIAYPMPLNPEVLKNYDLMISSFPHYVEKFKNMGIESEYLRWCAEDTILKEFSTNKRKYDITYVGGFSPHHSKGNKVLEKVGNELKINFWGYGQNFLTVGSNILKNYKGQAWGRKMYKIFSESKIVINRHINISGPYANNMRMFDVTLMGALLITDQKKNMEEFFKVGKEVVTYKDPADLINKIKYYLANEDERAEIAKNGQLRTLKEHTYRKRMGELSRILKKYIK